VTDGKSPTSAKRRYRGTVQAEVAELTRKRIFDAAIALYTEYLVDDITLKMIAERADVTVQTILRHFKSKEGLFSAGSKYLGEKIREQRGEAPVGDIAGALNNLMEHYETVGRIPLRMLALEGHSPETDASLRQGRNWHRHWVERVFAPYIARAEEPDRERLTAQLVTICDVYTWKLLRLDAGLTREETELAMYEMLTALFEKKKLLTDRGI
jgi:AcrR family transcriptional regulator